MPNLRFRLKLSREFGIPYFELRERMLAEEFDLHYAHYQAELFGFDKLELQLANMANIFASIIYARSGKQSPYSRETFMAPLDLPEFRANQATEVKKQTEEEKTAIIKEIVTGPGWVKYDPAIHG